MDMDKLIKETIEKLDVVYQSLLEEYTADMTGEELHQLMIDVRDWVNLRFGEGMRVEIIRRYTKEALNKTKKTKPNYDCMLNFEHSICYYQQCRYCKSR